MQMGGYDSPSEIWVQAIAESNSAEAEVGSQVGLSFTPKRGASPPENFGNIRKVPESSGTYRKFRNL